MPRKKPEAPVTPVAEVNSVSSQDTTEQIPAVTKVKVSVSGQLKGTAEVDAGTPLNKAMALIADTYGKFLYRRENGKPIGLNAKVTENINITCVEKTSGG